MSIISFCCNISNCYSETNDSMLDLSQLMDIDPTNSNTLSATEEMVDVHSIIRLTFENNPDIIAARYELEAAEYQFKDFQRSLSQFTPLLMNSKIERDVRHPYENQNYELKVGMEKEYFNGSSVSVGVGHRGELGEYEDDDYDYDSGTSEFMDVNVRFPLFGSNTTLRRITQRSREENEMYNARLSYIDTIRNVIRDAQDTYFGLLEIIEQVKVNKKAITDYEDILNIPRVQSNKSDYNLVNTTIKDLKSDILSGMGECSKQMSYVRSSMGIEYLSNDQIDEMDVYAEDYYGISYMSKTLENLKDEAAVNDIRIRVLENAKKNSIEKKLLADKGKWDIFVDLNGRYDFESDRNYRDDNGYSVGVGFSIQKIDSTLLQYSSRRAEAEIRKYEAEILSQQLNTRTKIDREWNIARDKRELCEELVINLKSRQEVYLQKKEDYVNGKESIDNLITSREEIRQTEMDLLMYLDDFYESITNLNHACGVYFQELGINI